MRRRPSLEDNHERWLVSYADFVTLLFAFFVVLFASSTADQAKRQSFASRFESYVKRLSGGEARFVEAAWSPGSNPKALSAPEPDSPLERLEAELWPEIEDGKIELSVQPRGLVMSLSESALFARGDAKLQPHAKPVMRKVGRALSRVAGQIRLEGHTDNTPIHTREYPSNWQLSTARAITVLKFLIHEAGIPSDRLAAAGYGKFRPLVPNDSAENRAKNRRVDVVILTKGELSLGSVASSDRSESQTAPSDTNAAD